jgi:multicomponent K+:H+ antiporter subunit G
MNGAAEAPALVSIVTAVLVVAGAAMTLIGSLGLVRLRDFYQRVHAPTLGTTLGTACIAIGSVIYFSALATRPVVHELLLLALAIVTTPAALMILVRAARFRDRSEGEAMFTAGQGARPEYPRSGSAEPLP